MTDEQGTITIKTVVESEKALDPEVLNRLKEAFHAKVKEELGPQSKPNQRFCTWQHQTQEQVNPPK